MKTPITYYGGKQTLVKHLLPLIPDHKLYCEPFFGGGALFFAKPPSLIEVINDLNGEVMNFYRVARLKFTAIEKMISVTLHSRDLYRKATVIYQNPDMFSDVKRAWAFWTLANQGFGGTLSAWGAGRDNSKSLAVSYKREEFTSAYTDRLATAQIESMDALKVIERCDGPDSFFYLDPPYFNSNMGHYAGYSQYQYEKLLGRLAGLQGKFILSSYPSEVLSRVIEKNSWQVRIIEKPVAVTKKTYKKKIEMVVANFSLNHN